jgi:peptidoglycan/xylan/chitin deacetylase (PgdA/CDA1 family)
MAVRLPILTFHDLDDRPSVISFPPELFRRFMLKLHQQGYRTMSLLEAINHLRLKKPFPERSFVITFDDGYESVYEEAFPVLQDCGMTATIFLTLGGKGKVTSGERLPAIEGRSMLNWQEILEMKQGGVTLGAHTLTHPDLTRLPPDRMEAEIRDSKEIIEDILGTPIACFAYPYGRYDDRSHRLVQQHFACACSDDLGLVTLKGDPFALKRVDAYYLRTEKRFKLMWTGLFPCYIRALSIPRGIRRFVQNGLR